MLRTTSFDAKMFYVLSKECIYLFRMDLGKTNIYFLRTQPEILDFVTQTQLEIIVLFIYQ